MLAGGMAAHGPKRLFAAAQQDVRNEGQTGPSADQRRYDRVL
jgi:hypothetical protein